MQEVGGSSPPVPTTRLGPFGAFARGKPSRGPGRGQRVERSNGLLVASPAAAWSKGRFFVFMNQ